jgi:hypothetical protein
MHEGLRSWLPGNAGIPAEAGKSPSRQGVLHGEVRHNPPAALRKALFSFIGEHPHSRLHRQSTLPPLFIQVGIFIKQSLEIR